MDFALVAATVVLVVVTGYYAWQTHETVEELRSQREQSATIEEERRRAATRSLRAAVLSELEQINAIVTGAPTQGVQYARTEQAILPRDAWKAAFGNAEAFPPGAVRDELHALYALIERVNGLNAVLLYLGLDARYTGGDAERERTSGVRGLKEAVPTVIALVRELPSPA